MSRKNQIIICISILFILFLTIININNYLRPLQVLGASVEKTSTNSVEDDFWKLFLEKNPNYLPGLIETGNIESAMKIDPNFLALP